MTNKNTVGRPSKLNYTTMIKLADALQHSASISDACRYAGISRDTYYRHRKNEPIFAEMMNTAIANQHKLMFSFLTT
ncbi:MAG TPA: hypothetical protein VGE13_00950 [Candidatus Saccharimonadales bacterium]